MAAALAVTAQAKTAKRANGKTLAAVVQCDQPQYRLNRASERWQQTQTVVSATGPCFFFCFFLLAKKNAVVECRNQKQNNVRVAGSFCLFFLVAQRRCYGRWAGVHSDREDGGDATETINLKCVALKIGVVILPSNRRPTTKK